MTRPNERRATLRPFSRRASLLAALLAGFAVLGAGADARAQAAVVPYQPLIQGVEDGRLLQMLRDASDAFGLVQRPPATIPLLERRAQRDIQSMQAVLRSEGYYAASVEPRVDADATPARVIFAVTQGPRFVLGSVDVRLAEGAGEPDFSLPGPAVLGLELGQPALSRPVVDAERRLLRYFRTQGHPQPSIADRRVVVDHAEHEMRVTYIVNPGPSAVFGATEFEGLDRVRERYLRRIMPWEEGDPFTAARIDDFQRRLTETGLFSVNRVTLAGPVEDGRAPIAVEATERPPRTIRLGLNYRTDDGLGARTAWEHRNLFRQGERLQLSLNISEIRYGFESRFDKPAFLHPEQSLLLALEASEDRPDAYTSQAVTTSAFLERRFTETLTVGAGVRTRVSEVEQLGVTRRHGLLSLPLYLDWDRRDDPLDPTRGGRLNQRLTAFHDIDGADVGFLRSSTSYSHYLQVIDSPSIILAARGHYGFMYGSDREEIPADERFYAGGGGSIRGYAYQSVGPRFEDNTPLGGRSLLELAFEARFRFRENIGAVLFVDGGNVWEDEYPDFDDELFWGAGLGLRYHTPIGPIRADVAFPLNKRADDDTFQIYISIGHAF